VWTAITVLFQDRAADGLKGRVQLARQRTVLALHDPLDGHRELAVDPAVLGVVERHVMRFDVDRGQQLLRDVMERALDEPRPRPADLPQVPPSAALAFDLAEKRVDPRLEGVADGLLDGPRGDDRAVVTRH
jgi:hypothetical protein